MAIYIKGSQTVFDRAEDLILGVLGEDQNVVVHGRDCLQVLKTDMA